MKFFSNKVVVVTGGSSGIGKAVAQSFYQQGAKIVILGRDSIAKAALSVLAKSFSADLIKRKIRVNSISPGFTDTPIFIDKTIIPIASELVPLKRFATPEEIANAAIFLTTNEYIVGVDLLIDGGISTLRPEFR